MLILSHHCNSYTFEPKLVFETCTKLVSEMRNVDNRYYISFEVSPIIEKHLISLEKEVQNTLSQLSIQSVIRNSSCTAKLVRKYNKFETVVSGDLDVYNLPLNQNIVIRIESNYIWLKEDVAGLSLCVKEIRSL